MNMNVMFTGTIQNRVDDGDFVTSIKRMKGTLIHPHPADQRACRYVGIGRTHLQDAVPLTVGQEVGGWAAQLRSAAERLEQGLLEVRSIPLG